MATDRLESRFVERLQFEVGDAEVAQELSIPRKSRRLDVVCRFGEAPVMFDALRADCSCRTVVFEHVSASLQRHQVARAWSSMAWLLWEQVRTPRRGRRAPMLRPEPGERPPLGIIVTDHVSAHLQGAVPALRPTDRPGLWATPELDEGGLYVINASEIDPTEGLAWWAWIGLARIPAEEAARLTTLLGDPNLPIDDRTRIEEALVNGQLSASPVEQETVAQRLRREGRMEGRLEGQREGRLEGQLEGQLEGRVEALLELAMEVAPERVEELRAITDVQALQRAVFELLRR